MGTDIIGYVCPICDTPNPISSSYCIKCGHWLLDTRKQAKPITEKEYKKKHFTGITINSSNNRLLKGGIVLLALFAAVYVLKIQKVNTTGITANLAASIKQISSSSLDPSLSTIPSWNTSDLDYVKNGNFDIAIQKLKSVGDTEKAAVDCVPGDVLKRPWDYYGKILKLSGKIIYVYDYPPSNDMASRMDGSAAAQLEVRCNDGTKVYDFIARNSGDIKIGDTVSLYGFPIGGTLDTSNNLDGQITKITSLNIVGNKFSINN